MPGILIEDGIDQSRLARLARVCCVQLMRDDTDRWPHLSAAFKAAIQAAIAGRQGCKTPAMSGEAASGFGGPVSSTKAGSSCPFDHRQKRHARESFPAIHGAKPVQAVRGDRAPAWKPASTATGPERPPRKRPIRLAAVAACRNVCRTPAK